MKISPYHSTSTEDLQRQRYVHHDHGNCPDGKRIKSYNKRAGTGGFPRCDECIKLG
jgi:competence protein ComGC